MAGHTGDMTYTVEQKALVAAAAERYREITALRVVAANFDLRPSRATVHAWIREQGLQPTDETREEIGELERQRKAGWQATIDAQRDATFEAFGAATEARNYLGMQQSATAIGILYDKLVPPVKAGLTVNTVGSESPVQLFVIAPPLTGPDGERLERPVDDSHHQPVVDAEARELPPLPPAVSRS